MKKILDKSGIRVFQDNQDMLDYFTHEEIVEMENGVDLKWVRERLDYLYDDGKHEDDQLEMRKSTLMDMSDRLGGDEANEKVGIRLNNEFSHLKLVLKDGTFYLGID